MTDLRTAAQQALEALNGLSEDAVCQSSHHAKKDRHTSLDVCPVFLRLRAAITALRAALAEHYCDTHCTWADHAPECPLAEPVQQGCDHCNHPMYAAIKCRVCGRVTKPALPQRKPLTEKEIDNIWDSEKAFADIYAIVRAIERAHGIGGQP